MGRSIVSPESIALFYLILCIPLLVSLLWAFLQAVRTIELKKHAIVDVKTLIDPAKDNTQVTKDITCDLVVARHVIFESNQHDVRATRRQAKS